MNKEKLIDILKNIAAIVVILALFVIIFYQNRDRDIFKFGESESSKLISSNTASYDSDTYLRSDVSAIGDKVAFITPSSFTVLDKAAAGKNFKIAFSQPIMHTKGEYAVIYDENTKNAIVYKMDSEAYRISTENRIIKAKINSNGYLLAVTEKDGYNCECSVYNKTGEAIFRWNISKSEFLDGAVSSSNKELIISVASAKEQKLCGEIIQIDITDAKVIRNQTFDSELFYGIEVYKNDTYAAFGNKKLVYFNNDGTKKWSFGYKDRKLIKADITEPDMMVLVLMAEGSVLEGTECSVEVINRLGKRTAEKTYEETPDDIAVTNGAVAMAFGKNILVTDDKLREKKSLQTESGTEKLALFDDEKHLFVIGDSDSKIIE